MKRDVQATEAKHFFSPKSYVAKDGREVLFGLDWKQRVGELHERSGGRCEGEIEVEVWDSHLQHAYSSGFAQVRCTREAAHPHHRIKRSKSRDDRMKNLIALCFECHLAEHPEKRQMWRKS